MGGNESFGIPKVYAPFPTSSNSAVNKAFKLKHKTRFLRSIEDFLERFGAGSAEMFVLVVLSSLIPALVGDASCSSAGNALLLTTQDDVFSTPLNICNNTFILLESNKLDYDSVYTLKHTSPGSLSQCAFPNGDTIMLNTNDLYFTYGLVVINALQFKCFHKGIYTCNTSQSQTLLFGVYSSGGQCSSTHGELISA